MIFLISLALALLLVFICSGALKKRPAPFYVAAAVIAAAVTVCTWTGVKFPLWFSQWVWPVLARGALAGALFVLVMAAGAFPAGSAGAKRLMPLRGQLSILASILTLGHNAAYGRTYFALLFAQPGRLPVNQLLASLCSVVMILIMLPLFVTSFQGVRKRMDGKRWKKLQRLAYVFYALLCCHILLLIVPYAVSGRAGYKLSVFIYTSIFTAYALCRVMKAAAKDRAAREALPRRQRRGVAGGVILGAAVLLLTIFAGSKTAEAANAIITAPPAEITAPPRETELFPPTSSPEMTAPPEEAETPGETAAPEPTETVEPSEETEAPKETSAPAITPEAAVVPTFEPTTETTPEPTPEPTTEPASVYRDGSYTGTGIGFEGPITVSVTIQDDRITGISVLSAGEDEPFWSDAKGVIYSILAAQTPNVDAVSGATSSSHGIIDAVRQALESAKN